MFSLRKNNIEWEFETYHKILPLYLYKTLTAVVIVNVTDYEVNMIIFCAFYSVYKYETLNGKKGQKRQILENIILS